MLRVNHRIFGRPYYTGGGWFSTNEYEKFKKSYSPEGFIVNFFKFFFVDIGTFLVRSSNEGFEKKSFIRLTKARQNYLRA